MTWEIWACIGFVVLYVALYWYALTHRDDPFWHGFLDPFGWQPMPRPEPMSDTEALRRDWEAVAGDMRKAVEALQKSKP